MLIPTISARKYMFTNVLFAPYEVNLSQNANDLKNQQRPTTQTSTRDCNRSRASGIAFLHPVSPSTTCISSPIAQHYPPQSFTIKREHSQHKHHRGSSFALSKN